MRRRLMVVGTCLGLLAAACTADGEEVTRGSAAPTTSVSVSAIEPSSPSSDVPGTPATAASTTSTTSTTVVTTTTTIPPQPPIDLSSIVTGDPELLTGTLPNGLTYFVRHNDNPGGSVQLRLAVRAGSGREAQDQSGVAHFLEHMLFNGTASFPENELIDVLRSSGAQFGADVNAYTSYDETVYQLSVPSRPGTTQALTTAIQVLQEWLSAATLDPAAVVAERGVVLDEYRSRQETSDGRLRNGFQDLFLAGSVYASRAPIGTPAAIEAMTPELLRRFYDEWYRPDNAAVSVIGDIDPATVQAQIAEAFGGLQPRAVLPDAGPLSVVPSAVPATALLLDPDVRSASVELSLPAVSPGHGLETVPQSVADSLVFAMIANRLIDDAVTVDVAFDAARVDGNSFVVPLDAPSVVVDAKPGRTGEAMVALLDEFERVRRHGFSPGELERAIGTVRARAANRYASRETRQDAILANETVEAFLHGTPILTEQARFDLSTIVLDAMTVERVDERFQQRWAASAPHVIVVGPERDTASLPTAADIAAAIESMPARDIADRPPATVVTGPLMVVPEPVAESSSTVLTAYPDVLIDGPTRLEFANGVTVLLEHTNISNGEVVLRAESSGGLAHVAADDVVDARVAADVVTAGGVGAFDRAQLNQLLAASSVSLSPSIGHSDDAMAGESATVDLETLLQLVHQFMVAPRFDPVALANVLTDVRATAADPFADQVAAVRAAAVTARYGDDPRFRVPLTAADADAVDLGGIERVWRANFGNAAGWTFAIAGDFDLPTTVDLARRYLGSLPAAGPDAAAVEIVPLPPAEVVAQDILAGTGDRATLVRSYSTTVPSGVDTLVLADLATEIVAARLTTRIREELGESYSPSAAFVVTPSPVGADARLDVFIEITTAPGQVGSVSSVLTDELAALAAEGASTAEIDAARAVVQERYNIFNEEIAEVLIGSERGVGETASDYHDRYRSLATLTPTTIRAFLALPANLGVYVEVGATPR